MEWIKELSLNESLQNTLSQFLEQYGTDGLERALFLYNEMQQEYICKTKSSISKIKLDDIYYFEIKEHNICIHTQNGTYRKYGSLVKEQSKLSPHIFIRCNQSCIVSLRKIATICNNEITLINNTQLHMSQHYAPKVLMAFSRNSLSR